MCEEVSVGVDCCGIDDRHEPLFRVVEAIKKNATTPFGRKWGGRSQVNGRFRALPSRWRFENTLCGQQFSHSSTFDADRNSSLNHT